MRTNLCLVAAVAACSSAQSVDQSPPPDAGGAPDARPVAMVSTTRQLCKLLSNRHVSDPTANDVQHRANILGADLGIPVVHGNTFYIMSGDTIGYRGIWGTESHPDAVGYALDSAATVGANPAVLCSRMGIITLSAQQSIGPTVDATIQRDFAGVAMAAPPGHTLGEFIRNPSGSGANLFPQLPGDFEVPSGAFAHGDAIYVFYTTVVGPGNIAMKGSYLAKWTNPSSTGIPLYQILYGIDQRFDANGALGGNFINIAAQVRGDYVYLFGTGEYRKSGIHLARKRLDQLATPGGFEDLGEIVQTKGYGEASVRYFPVIDRWMLLAEELSPTSNRIVARFADVPEGPWSGPQIVHDMGDPAFREKYCCAAQNDCRDQQFFHCNRTGFYGTYLFPDVTPTSAGFTVTYTMSSFDPYNVALYQATFEN